MITNLDRYGGKHNDSDDSDYDDMKHVVGAKQAMRDGETKSEVKSLGGKSRWGVSRSGVSMGGASMKSSRARSAAADTRKKASGLHSGTLGVG